MEPTPAIQQQKPIVHVDGSTPSMNGDGLWHDLNIFWLVVRKFRMLFLAVFSSATILFFILFTVKTTYTSQARFTIPDWSQSFPSQGNTLYSQDRMNQTLMLFLSDSVLSFLIDKYHLLSKVKNPESTYAVQEEQAKVSKWISLKPSAFNSFLLEVTTDDRILSANVANDILKRSMQMSTQAYERDLANRIDVLKNLLTTIGSGNSGSDDLLALYFERMQKQLDELSENKLPSKQLQPVIDELNLLQKQYDDRVLQLRINEMMLKQVSENSAASITVVQSAVPDFNSYTFIHLIYSVLLGLVVCSLLPFTIHAIANLRGKKLNI